MLQGQNLIEIGDQLSHVNAPAARAPYGCGLSQISQPRVAMSQQPAPVIVVDDDEAVRNSLKFALELEGFNVRIYESGPALLAAAGPVRGCLVVDQYMPGMTGIELVEQLRERSCDVPAILITAKASDSLRLSAALHGIRQVLEKPLQDGALLDSIASAVTASRI